MSIDGKDGRGFVIGADVEELAQKARHNLSLLTGDTAEYEKFLAMLGLDREFEPYIEPAPERAAKTHYRKGRVNVR